MKTLPNEFQAALDRYLQAAQQKIADHWTAMKYTHAEPESLVYTVGSRFVAVYAQNSTGKRIHSFIDIAGGPHLKTANKSGDILKPATFKAPAKHARGNIFDADAGASCLSEYGPVYLSPGRKSTK